VALNTRQTNFIAQVRNACKDAESLNNIFFSLSESFKEEFATGKDNDLSLLSAELAEWGLTFGSIEKSCGQLMAEYVDFWQGGEVTPREYGKIARRVADNQ
jgi:hypothetical protein